MPQTSELAECIERIRAEERERCARIADACGGHEGRMIAKLIRGPFANQMTPQEKARDMRSAIDAMELAMMGWPELVDLPEKWGEPRHRPNLKVSVPGTTEQVYRICDALSELTRIINSPEYSN